MKLGVMSDSHDNVPNVKRAVALFNEIGVDLVVHAGDFIAPFAIDPLADLNCHVVGVFGNNDGERVVLVKKFEAIGGEVHPNLASTSLGDTTIAVMHYPELAIPIAKSGEYDIVVYGHTHKIDIQKEESLLLNPGETGGWTTGKATIAVVELEALEATIYEL
ncbi:MAG: metallophosphoesterase [Candidatus Poribacteria bacterium]|nr:metallophosphoesterase [Candidatus Poribacteria bacterium]